MKIAIASDHRGYKLKEKLVKYLTKKKHEVVDLGTSSIEPADYPEYGIKLGEYVANNDAELGIAICGSGIGISIACNKVKGIRCAKVSTVKDAKLSRVDNDANIMALSSTTPILRVLDCVDKFINTSHPLIERHDNRIKMISDYENKRKIKRKDVEE